MKRVMKLTALMLLTFSLTILTLDAVEPVSQAARTVKFSGGSRTVTSVLVNLNDPSIRLEEVPAQNTVGKTEELSAIAKRAGSANADVIAAINGTFFSAYSKTDFQPYGDIVANGELVHYVSAAGAFSGITVNNKFMLENVYANIKGSIDGSWEYPYNWAVYAINHKVDSDYLLTPKFGTATGDCGASTLVVVKAGVVSTITKG
ncbi:MAG: hypothetical protein N2376_14705, partial [Clostridia bacterium]|nr:hypothetical protein [Clostridia bacterium]